MSERKKIIAPTDPKFKGKYFYLYRNLDFEAILRPTGRRTTENYLDMGRINSAVKINGGIEDESILGMFNDAKGTQELFKGVGVSITSEDDTAKFQFSIIYYGKKDRYGTGTHIVRNIISNGVEEYIDFSDIDFSEDDAVLGQLEIEFPDELSTATMTVKIYVDEKYDISVQSEEDSVDITSPEYTAMIKNSLCAVGNNERFLSAVNKAKSGEDVTVAFIGGSITQGAGAVPQDKECYAYKAYMGFKRLIEKEAGVSNAENIHYIRAGIGGTPSELGVVRYDKDVRSFGTVEPDVVVVEFAVNDDGDETNGDCYEGLMRKIWFNKNKPALILLFSVFADDFNLQERFIPIGEKYGVPMVSVKNAVTPQFNKSADDGRVITKRQYFYDIFHPSNVGHTIMADCIINYYNEAVSQPLKKDIDNPPVVRSDDFDNIIYFDRKLHGRDGYVNQEASPSNNCEEAYASNNIKEASPSNNGEEACPSNNNQEAYPSNNTPEAAKDTKTGCSGTAYSYISEYNNTKLHINSGSFTLTDKNLQEVERNLDNFPTPCFPDNWMHEPGKNEPFTVTLECKLFMIIFKDTSDIDHGAVNIKADGNPVRQYDPKEIGWVHCNAIIALREKEAKRHTFEISMTDGDIDKYATILGFGYVN